MSKPEPVWKLFSDQDPYAGFDPAAYPEDRQGWGLHPIFKALIAAIRPATIVEVGTWKGASAIHMAETARSLDLRPSIICIDTWLGTIESYTWRAKDPSLHEGLRLRHGWPHLYYQFLANVVRSGFAGQIVPLPQTSQIGMRLIRELGVKPDLIFIDASHDYHDVQQDLMSAWACVSDQGVIFGDDYLSWDGVTKAVDEFCRTHNLILLGGPGKFAIARQGNIFDLAGQQSLIEPDGSFGGLKLCRPLA